MSPGGRTIPAAAPRLEDLLPERIARLARLEVRAKHIVEGVLSGLHRSPYFGQSIEFRQHREYVPGDEARNIDWKVWSKTDKYYVKLFDEDTNLRTTIVVDRSASMAYGSGAMTKADYARTVAASLAYLLIKQHDIVGLVTCDSEIRDRVPHRSGQRHLLSLIGPLEAPELDDDGLGATTALGDTLATVAEEQTRAGIVVVVSDLFTDTETLFRGLRFLRSRGHDVVVFQVLDDSELDFDFVGTTRFEGLEADGELTCDPPALRASYLAALERFMESVRRFCGANAIDLQTIRTSEHLDAAILAFMKLRSGPRR
ncbi:MAG: DUF58 domain-containing protein [Planctomycetota bacterium]